MILSVRLLRVKSRRLQGVSHCTPSALVRIHLAEPLLVRFGPVV
jgi:hypothetical protein